MAQKWQLLVLMPNLRKTSEQVVVPNINDVR
jgi:hypothetical protein